jgi:alpha-glucosidase
MKFQFQFILLIGFIFLSFQNLSAKEYTVKSQDGKVTAVVTVDKGISIAAYYQTRLLFNANNLMMEGESKVFNNYAVLNEKRNFISNSYKPVVRIKSAVVQENCNQLILEFKGYAFECRVYDEGVAYRFIGKSKGETIIINEKMALTFPENTMLYYPEEKSFFSHNERYYQHKKIQDIEAETFCSLPLLAVANNVNVLVTESNLDDYPGMWLKKGKNKEKLNAIFPQYPKGTEQTTDRDVKVRSTEDYIAKTSASRGFPWRIFAIAAKDADLLTNQLTWILSAKNQLENSDWIKPGKVAWDWWNFNNIYGVDFEAGVNTQTYKHYIDFAAEFGIEYIILDEGWYKLGDLTAIVPEIDMEELSRYAKEKNVGLVLWVVWKTLDDQLEPVLDQFEKWNIKGIKVDFMQRDDQWMVNYYERIAMEAGKRKMLVDFHGSYKPAGLHRKYPNVVTREGVCGLEHNKWTDKATPEHDVTIPFIRMVAGPMDYTPGAMLNASEKHFSANFNRPMSLGTRCHQLAMYVVYESPLQMLADSPSNYRHEAEVMEFLSPVPTTWDETKILDAKIGDYVITARKSNKEWYIGAMSDWEERDFKIKLDFLDKGKSYKAIIFKDGKNAHRYAGDYMKEEVEVNADGALKIHIAPGGGWVARIVEQ